MILGVRSRPPGKRYNTAKHIRARYGDHLFHRVNALCQHEKPKNEGRQCLLDAQGATHAKVTARNLVHLHQNNRVVALDEVNQRRHLVMLLCDLFRIHICTGIYTSNYLAIFLHNKRRNEREQTVDLLGRTDDGLHLGDAVHDADGHLLPGREGTKPSRLG